MIKILEATELVSASFGTGGTRIHVVIDTFAAGAPWNLEYETPAGNWVVVNDQDFSDSGAWGVETIPGGKFRFSGGAVGAQIWVEGAYLIG